MKIDFYNEINLHPHGQGLSVSAIEIFRTTISDFEESEKIKKQLLTLFPTCRINFDLQDCDRILRVEGQFSSEIVIAILQSQRYECEILD